MLGPVEVVAEVDSTNSRLLERARQGAPEGVVLVADHQRAGRGRLGRSWEAAPGAALLVSVLLRPSLRPAEAHLVTAVAGLAAVDVVTALGGEVGLKWPNDVVAGEAKLAGLLSEAVVEGRVVEAVVVGMGLNLLGAALPSGGVALAEVLGHEVARDTVLAAWLEAFEDRYQVLLGPGGVAATVEAMRRSCVTLGRRVRVELPGRTVVGTAEDLGPEGSLLVVTDDGERCEVRAGDVVHVRPAPG